MYSKHSSIDKKLYQPDGIDDNDDTMSILEKKTITHSMKNSTANSKTFDDSPFNPLIEKEITPTNPIPKLERTSEQMHVLSKETKLMYKKNTNLLSRGWEIYDLQLPQEIIQQSSHYLQNLKEKVFSNKEKVKHSIFQRTYIDDKKPNNNNINKQRYQYKLNKTELEKQAWFKEFKKQLNHYLLQKGRNCILQECFLLYSEKGCEKQENHRDYAIFNSHYLSGIFSFDLTSNTFLNIADNDYLQPANTTGKKSLKEQTQRIQIPVGSVLLFRDDNIHSGAAYKHKSNLRLYFKSYPKNVVSPISNEEDININLHNEMNRTFRCTKCGKGGFKNCHAVKKHQTEDCPKIDKDTKEKNKKHLKRRNIEYQQRHKKKKKVQLQQSYEELEKLKQQTLTGVTCKTISTIET